MKRLRLPTWRRSTFARPGGGKSVASFTAVSVIAGSLVFAAVTSEGYRTTSTDLHDGTVWTLGSDRGAAVAARVNARIEEFDTVIRVPGVTDIFQDGTAVFVQSPSGMAQLNGIGTSIDGDVQFAELDPGSQIGVAGRTGAVLGPDGRLWVVPAGALSSIDPTNEPMLALNAGSRLAVSPDGVAVVLDPVDDTIVTVTNRSETFVGAESQFDVSEPRAFGHDLEDPGASTGDFAMSAVGSDAVVLAGDDLLLSGGDTVTIGDGDTTLRLQQPGVSAQEVLVAGDAALYAIPVDGGEVRRVVEAGAGQPAAPVVVGGCAYAGWESTGTVWMKCGGDDPIQHEIEDGRGTDWIFRVNRDQVVLEARGADPRLVTDDGLVAVDNWQDFDSDREEEDETLTEVEPDQSEQAVCKDEAAPPEAHDDTYGATPAVAVVLRVLDNDRDPNCDPIALQPLAEDAWNPSWGTIALIDQNQAFQYTPPATPVSFQFAYTIDDGSGGEATATVAVDVDAGSNAPPEATRPSETIVEMFKTVRYNVLFDWIDPNGDTLLLDNASLAAGDGSIVWSKDGTITYTAGDTVAGPKEIQLAVSDGRGGITAGVLNVSVQGEGVPLPPTARDDYVRAPAGREVVVEPLRNDTDPNNDPLVLGEYGRPEAVRIDQGEGGALRLTSDTPGTHLIAYDATDGNARDSATIRFEVVDPALEQQPPVPVRDSVVMKVGRSLNIDVLANDFDADGDVLALTDARLQQVGIAGIDVKTIDRRFVRVQVDQDPGTPLVIEYLVTDGRSAEQVGQLVVNVAPATGNQRPVPSNDAVRVRVNDVVDIPVLENDIDPDGDQINILSATLDPATQPGVLWLDGKRVRYRAGAEAGTIKAKYTIDDTPERSGLNASSGFIEITVVDATPDKNLPPVAPTLEARVFAGATVTIPVPTAGLDPDGDSVRLTKIGKAPPPLSLPAQLGVPRVAGTSIAYTANAGANGQDLFSYEIVDAFGARSVGNVRVAVVDAPNHPPSLVPDVATTRPGRILQVPVLANDNDPDGDALSLEGVEAPDELDVTVNDGRVQVIVPDEAGSWQIYYSATDGKSSPITQVVTVTSDPDAPLLPAVARDDPDDAAPLVPVEAADGTYTVTLDVLANDDDPDGARSELIVDIPPGQGVGTTVEPGTGVITVVLDDQPRAFVYAVTDFDRNVSHAVVRVPRSPAAPGGNRLPELRDDPIVVTIVEGEAGEIRVDDYVIDPDGDDVVLAGETPSSAQGEASVAGGNFESFMFTPAKGLGQPTAAVTVAVSDELDNPERTIELVFQIEVEQPNQPPTVQPVTVPVEQQGDAAPLDLIAAGAVADPENDDLEFTLLEGGGAGLDVELSGDGKMTASADGANEGLSATYRYSVSDGQPDRDAVEGTFTVEVVASTRPLVVLQAISRPDIRQGQAETAAVLQGVANPFPDTPLRVIGAELVDGMGAVTFDDSSVTFTPPDDYFGVAEVRYTVEDATQNASRHATGSVRYTVIGRPLPPGQPRVVEVYSHTAVVQWVPADPQGSPITDYTVRWAGGQISSGGATTVTIDTLTNNTPYTFTVSATNAVGASDESALSGEIIPDEVPPAPNAPRIVDFGDGTLSVEWDEVVPDGSPVTLYHLTVSGGATKPFPASQLSTVWEGLTNGTDYTFRLVAENNEGRGDASGLSGALSPAREPDAPTDVVATDRRNPLVAQADLTWAVPADNGRDIDFYEITAVATGQTYQSVTPNISINLPPGTTTSFTVRAHNVVGFSVLSAASAPFEFIKEPDAPGALSTAVGDRLIEVTSPVPDSGGAPIVRYEYQLNGGAWTVLNGASPAGTVGGLTNGSTYSVAARACNKNYCGPSSAAVGGLVPFGPPIAANITISRNGPASGSQSFTVSWNGAAAANGRAITSAHLTVSGGLANGAVAVSGSQGFSGNWSTSYTATLTVTDAAGGTASRDVAINVGARPNPTVTVPPPDRTCPEPFDGGASNWNGGTCDGRGGWINVGTQLTVSCRLNRTFGVYNPWLRIVSGGPSGWYVAAATVSGDWGWIPSC